MKRATLIFLIVLMAATVGCHRGKSRGGEEKLGPRIPKKDAEPAPGQTIDIEPGDHVHVELTVFHPPFLYLTGVSPVTVYTPNVPGWHFDKKEIALERPFFPLIIPFEISNDAALGPYTLRLAVRLQYAFKADDKPLSKNVIVEAPFRVIPGLGERREKVVRVPVEYTLEVTGPIEQAPLDQRLK